ncbi:hypothetical protein GN244_ATG06565 [Phytophthora infestans]|uniref:Uncharacterized protein n=1 Tax=Phytophthora infestans TaxID=4787 RepID=A0A833SXH5_PHYIN|nr:hypothetical protein GN244_ATG06565 [Phytophthora infestans]KAF4141564.1 hypothetical protein GN958_ATG09269 [Phytophthora infestans]KAF4141569.1 hypothetical protein GN958_ATG09274 [Phytophthora infestans]
MVASTKTSGGALRTKPHILGGSNNLVAERNRREKVEEALQTTQQNLRTVAQDLTPQVHKLAQAVEALQLEKRHQLQLDEASQELLETLQEQINEVEKRQQQCCVVDCRIENAVKELDDQSTADRFELRELISRLQEVQDEQATEIRLLHQELGASKTFLAQRMNAIEDAVTSVRSEIARGSEEQHANVQSHAGKLDELDEKLFALDKELLKVKLALPVSVKAQIPASFTDQRSASIATGRASRMDVTSIDDLAVSFRIQELAADLEAVKADSIAYRSADRQQFDALTNRLREAAKSHHALKKEVEIRLQDMRACYDQMIIKIPSELSRRLQKAQAAWDDEIETLKASVLTLEAFYNVQKRKESIAAFKSQSSSRLVDPEQQKLLEHVKRLQRELSSLREEHDSHRTRIDADLLGLYDWTRNQVTSIRRPSGEYE